MDTTTRPSGAAQFAERRLSLMSIERPGARVSVHYRHGDIDVMVVEIGGQGSISESTLWGTSSWHMVVEGRGVFQQGERAWELVQDESLRLDDGKPYTIVNPSHHRLKLLSVVASNGSDLEMAGLL
jgi:mannose-6-phosphate isomerase-like protein (cupin superfamily)